MFSGTTVRVLDIVCISSQPLEVGIVLHLFLISDFVMKTLKTFENCSQLAETVGKPDYPVY